MGGSATHDVMQERIYGEIKYQLRDHIHALRDPVLSDLLEGFHIEGHGQLSVALDAQCEGDVYGTKSPDAQLWAEHEGIRCPQFTMEVGYSHKNEDLALLAKQYHDGSNGNVKTVLTIKVPCRPPEKRKIDTAVSHDESNRPVFSLYRGPKHIHHDQALRNDDGTPVAGVSLQLFLSDFIPDSALERISSQHRTQIQETTISLPA